MNRPSTPCIQICRLDRGICSGCFRTLQEIANWSRMDELERQRIMREILPARREKARQG